MTQEEFRTLQAGDVVISDVCHWLVSETLEDLSVLRNHKWPASTTRILKLITPKGGGEVIHSWIGDSDAKRFTSLKDAKAIKKFTASLSGLI